MSKVHEGIIAVTGWAHCQRQVAFFQKGVNSGFRFEISWILESD